MLDGQIAGLEQQAFGTDLVNIKLAEQFVLGFPMIQ